jgi:hypothetical protein
MKLSQESPAWNVAFNHPYATGMLGVGPLSGVAAASGLEAYAAFGAATYPGVGAAYATQQAIVGTAYTALSLGAIGSIPNAVNSLGQVNLNNPSTFFPAAVNLTVQVGPSFAGGYVSALSHISIS